MIDLPKRSDSIYKEIEAFESYELTNCIAYEMMIRANSEDNISKEQYEEIKIEKIYLTDIGLFGFGNLGNIIDKIYPDYFKLDEEKAFQIYLKKNFAYLNKKDIEIYRIDFNQGKKYHINEILNDLEYFLSNFFNNNDIKFNEITIPSMLEDLKLDKPLLKEIIKNESFSKLANLKMKRPEIKTNNTKKIKIELNLSLPKRELIDFISKIKDEYDKDNSIIKNPLELLSEEFTKADDKHRQKKPKPEKWADWFYVYDCFKILKANRKDSKETLYNEIDLLLLEHYNSDKENYYSIETYKRTIMKNMIYLIDNLGYKELITGVANSNIND